MKDRLKRIIPGFAVVPLITILVFNMFVYYGSRLFTLHRKHHDLEIPLDQKIPFVPAAIIPYVMAYAQWALGYIVIARDSKETCDEVLSAELVAKAITFAIFMAFPTTMTRPKVKGNSLVERLIKAIYVVDMPRQLFPSLHCLESYLVVRGISRMKKKPPKAYTAAMEALTGAIVASTVLVKQHTVVDIVGGIALAELGLRCSRKWNTGRIFDRIRRVCSKKTARRG